MKLISYKPNVAGIKRLRASGEVDQMLERRADRVAAAARAAYAGLGEEIGVDVVQEGSDTKAPRARVAVIARSANALQLEAKHRVLGGSLDAARD